MSQPFIQVAFSGWFSPITVLKIKQQNNYGHNLPITTPINFEGAVQPSKAQKLQVKSEGQRFWKWWMIHSRTNLQLKKGDKLIYNGIRMKMMESWDYSLNGFYYYDLVEDYQDGVEL